MMTYEQAKEMKQLIKNGFDIELISLEFDIPISELEELKKQMDNKSANQEKKVIHKVDNDKKTDNSKGRNINSQLEFEMKLEKMRRRYMKLFNGISQNEHLLFNTVTPEEKVKTDQIIEEIKDTIEKMRGVSQKEKKNILKSILDKTDGIKGYNITLEQAERIVSLFESEEFKSFRYDQEDKTGYRLYTTKKMIGRKHAEAIGIAYTQTNDIDELRQLKNKITPQIERQNPIFYGSVKRNINKKISDLQQQAILNRLKNDIPISILEIATDLSCGNLDIEKAQKTIKSEAKKRLKNKPQNKFTLTEEQERNQILFQIRKRIEEGPDSIKNPEMTIMQLQELCNENIEQSISTVIENLINGKDFDTARSVCNEFTTTNQYGLMPKSMSSIVKRIRNAEISDVILRCINRDGTAEEECFRLIEKGLKMRNVNLSSISLGKSKDGLRNITLADIWPDEIRDGIPR